MKRRILVALALVGLLSLVLISRALDELMRKLIVIYRLLEAEERLPSAIRGPTRCNSCTYQIARLSTRSTSAGGFRLAPRRSRPLLLGGGRALDLAGEATR